MVSRLVPFCVCCFTVIFFVSLAFAGEAADLMFLRKVNPILGSNPEAVIRFNPQDPSELKVIATGLIRLYQLFISSQDGATCNFQPTCSHFGMACIQEHGVFRGILLTADRLLRCNGSPPQYYRKDSVTGRYLDPVPDF